MFTVQSVRIFSSYCKYVCVCMCMHMRKQLCVFMCVCVRTPDSFWPGCRGAKFNLCEINKKWVAGQMCVCTGGIFFERMRGGRGAVSSQAVDLWWYSRVRITAASNTWTFPTGNSFITVYMFRKRYVALGYIDVKTFMGWGISLRDKTWGRER